MKKLLKFLPFLLVALMATTFWSCSDDDDNKTVSNAELPEPAKTFLDTYYPSITYITKKDKNEFDVYLNNGHTVDFNAAGQWQDVDAPAGQTIPYGFYPVGIDTYIGENLSGAGINEISVEPYGYDVELVTGVDLRFGPDGTFLGYDR